MIVERDGSKTERREIRQQIRHILGVSHSPAPTARVAVDAAFYLDRVLSLATNGRFRLMVRDYGHDENLTVGEARDRIREETRI